MMTPFMAFVTGFIVASIIGVAVLTMGCSRGRGSVPLAVMDTTAADMARHISTIYLKQAERELPPPPKRSR